MISQKREKLKEQADRAFAKKNIYDATRLYAQAGNLGSADACYALAGIYLNDDHFAFNGKKWQYDKVVEWYTKASNLGHIGAQFALAKLYLEGALGMPTDKETGMLWLKKAADSGNAEAREYLQKFIFKCSPAFSEKRKLLLVHASASPNLATIRSF